MICGTLNLLPNETAFMILGTPLWALFIELWIAVA
jgi:hypothetical protein